MRRLFSREQEDFIRDSVTGLSNQELTDLVNERFEMKITVGQIKSWKNNHGVSSGLSGRFEKGHIPFNKNKKGLANVGGNRTSFKPGHIPASYRPVGSTRVDRDGYTYIKVSDGEPKNKRWRLKHQYIWEKEYGEIPKGHVVIFLDGNKENMRLNNLKLITNRQLLTINRNGWKFHDKELTETGLLMADLNISMIERKKSKC